MDGYGNDSLYSLVSIPDSATSARRPSAVSKIFLLHIKIFLNTKHRLTSILTPCSSYCSWYSSPPSSATPTRSRCSPPTSCRWHTELALLRARYIASYGSRLFCNQGRVIFCCCLFEQFSFYGSNTHCTALGEPATFYLFIYF